MKKINTYILLIACLFFPCCVEKLNTAILTRNIESIEEIAKDFRHNNENSGRLNFGIIASLPPKEIFIGGYLDEGSMSACSLLWASSNGGITWREIIRAHIGCEVHSILTFGEKHIWVLIVYSTEGTCIPSYLYRSEDGGNNWTLIELDSRIWTKTGLINIETIQFLGPKQGFAVLTSDYFEYPKRLIITKDGGESWDVLFSGEHNMDIEPADGVPKIWSPDNPATVTWGGSKIDSVIRIRENIENNRIIIEERDFEKKANPWEYRAVFPIEIKFNDISNICNSKISPNKANAADAKSGAAD